MLRAAREFLRQGPELRPFSLRFVDPAMEGQFQQAYFRDNLVYVRLAYVLGAVVWAAFGLLAQRVITDGAHVDLIIRFGIAIPTILIGLALTYTRSYGRYWQPAVVATVLVSGFLWSTHRALVEDARPDWGYAGLMLILGAAYTLTRLQFVYAVATGAAIIAYYNVVTILVSHDKPIDVLFADFFLVSFSLLGMAAAYTLERFARALFVRERELDRERGHADRLLENVLPAATVARLKDHDGEVEAPFIADGYADVSVLFADLVGFTEQAGRTEPAELVACLNEVFSRFDAVADRFGLEKIKTVGDAYMAVAGAPEPRPDHVEAAAEMALGVVESLGDARWPSGDPIAVRIGLASGPAVAGVIGRRKFAYDLWGDTVNMASRLESHGEPGMIQVSDVVHERLKRRYRFTDSRVVNLKGKGPTPAWFLLGRIDSSDAPAAPRRHSEDRRLDTLV